MLPSAPKDVGILSDVFTSALASITGTHSNRLGLKRVNAAVVFMVDGLGAINLSENLAYASNLRRKLSGAKVPSARVEFPATTAVSLTSLGTGLRSGGHGIAGYQVLAKDESLRNMLSGWGDGIDPLEWQPHETVAQRATLSQVRTFFVGPQEYEDSGFTKAFMRGADYVPADSPTERVRKALDLAQAKGTLVYCYFPELDKAAHKFGIDSSQWRAALEAFDSALAPAIDAHSGVLLTADHGVIDVPSSKHLYLDSLPGYVDSVRITAGDPRVAYIYGDSQAAKNCLEPYSANLYVCDYSELVDAGWCAPFTGESLIPDLIAIARGQIALYDRRTASALSTKMIGQHGGLDDVEQRVPLIRLGAYS